MNPKVLRERFCYLFILLFFKYVVYLKYRILKSEFSCLVKATYFAILNKLRAQKIINLVTVVFSIKLNFLKNEKKKRAIFKLNENMINVLKSDLRADRTAKIVKSGISFKHLAKLIKRGSDMNMMNRLVETKTMPLKG